MTPLPHDDTGQRIVPDLSGIDCEVVGNLNNCLGEDMVDVSLANGILVHAGWYPECDLSGSFKVSVARGLENLCPPIRTQNILEARQFVEQAARKYATLGKPYPQPHENPLAADGSGLIPEREIVPSLYAKKGSDELTKLRNLADAVRHQYAMANLADVGVSIREWFDAQEATRTALKELDSQGMGS